MRRGGRSLFALLSGLWLAVGATTTAEKRLSLKNSISDTKESVQQQRRRQQQKLQDRRAMLRRPATSHEKDLFGRGWRLVWSEGFGKHPTKTGLDETKWTAQVNCAGGGNNELQCYTDRPQNVRVNRRNRLILTALEENYRGPALMDDDPNYNATDTSITKPFTSARIVTKDKFDFRYGRVEVRAKLAGGQGVWPAIWMLPSTTEYGTWPLSGEIDIIEAVNLNTPLNTGNTVEGALHYGLPWPQWKVNFHTVDIASQNNPATSFHLYAIEWEQDEIRFYVDDQHYMTQTSAGWYNYFWQGQDVGFDVGNSSSSKSKSGAPFDQPFHLILNVAIGGDKPGPPDTSTSGWRQPAGVSASRMIVTTVKVYECTTSSRAGIVASPDGSGCAKRNDAPAVVKDDTGAPGINAYMLFDSIEGPATLQLPIEGSTAKVSNTLGPGFFEANPGNVVQQIIPSSNAEGFIWDIQFNGVGNVFLTSDAMEDDPAVIQGVQLSGGSGWTINGELSFDMKVLTMDTAETEVLLVKMDSGYPNLGQTTISTPPADGAWHRVVVRVSDLLSNPLPWAGGLDLENILNLFVLEYTGEAGIHVQIRNIRLQCAFNTSPEEWQLDQLCGMQARRNGSIDPFVNLYVNGNLDADLNLGLSDGGAATIEEIDFEGEPVLRFLYDEDPNTNTVAFFQYTTGPKDLSAWAGGGTIEFDLYIVREPNPAAAPNPLFMKVDCGFPSCTTGDVPLTVGTQSVQPTTGAWQHYTFSVDDLVNRGLDLSRVDAPFVFFPTWGSQNGAEYYLKNVQWIQAGAS